MIGRGKGVHRVWSSACIKLNNVCFLILMIARLGCFLKNTYWATLKQYNILKQTHSVIQIQDMSLLAVNQHPPNSSV